MSYVQPRLCKAADDNGDVPSVVGNKASSVMQLTSDFVNGTCHVVLCSSPTSSDTVYLAFMSAKPVLPTSLNSTCL